MEEGKTVLGGRFQPSGGPPGARTELFLHDVLKTRVLKHDEKAATSGCDLI